MKDGFVFRRSSADLDEWKRFCRRLNLQFPFKLASPGDFVGRFSPRGQILIRGPGDDLREDSSEPGQGVPGIGDQFVAGDDAIEVEVCRWLSRKSSQTVGNCFQTRCHQSVEQSIGQ